MSEPVPTPLSGDSLPPPVPHTLHPYPRQTLLDVLRESAGRRPNHEAVRFQGGALSYRRLETLSTRLAHALRRRGVMGGERVALLLPNSPQFLIAQLGCWKAGAIVAPINPQYTAGELVGMVNEVGATVAVVLTPFYRQLKEVQPRTSLRTIIVSNIKEFLPPLRRLLFSLLRERREGHRVAVDAGDLRLPALLQAGGDGDGLPQVGPGDPALLMFTGGTTGRPKAALSTHGALFKAGLQINAWLAEMIVPWEDRVLLYMPLFHTYGNVGVCGAALVGRLTMVPVPDPRDLDGLLAVIQAEKPALLAGVPTLFTALLNHPRVQADPGVLQPVQLFLSGAAALEASTRARFEALTGSLILEGYALTESVMALVMNPVLGPRPAGSVGLPLPDVEVRIVGDAGPDRPLPPGHPGEIVIRAPQLMAGYWERPQETAAALRGGWLYTGDVGYLDQAGYLFFVEREKDVIKPSGFQVWPREVEAVLAEHPAVGEVCVAGVPDPRRSEAVKAWVVLRRGTAATVAELRDHCREHLAAYKVPRHVEFRTDLPKSAVGKVLRRTLVAQHEEPAGEEGP